MLKKLLAQVGHAVTRVSEVVLKWSTNLLADSIVVLVSRAHKRTSGISALLTSLPSDELARESRISNQNDIQL